MDEPDPIRMEALTWAERFHKWPRSPKRILSTALMVEAYLRGVYHRWGGSDTGDLTLGEMMRQNQSSSVD